MHGGAGERIPRPVGVFGLMQGVWMRESTLPPAIDADCDSNQVTCRPLAGANEFAAGKSQSPPSRTRTERSWRGTGHHVRTVDSSVGAGVWSAGQVAGGASL